MKKQETIEEVAERLYPVNNTGSMFMANRDELNNSLKQEGFIQGTKRQKEKYDLLLIELNHTKTLLASCEKALEDSFKKQEIRYSEEEVENILIEYIKTNPTKPYRVVSWFTQFKKK
jgi:hypothetical protein